MKKTPYGWINLLRRLPAAAVCLLPLVPASPTLAQSGKGPKTSTPPPDPIVDLAIGCPQPCVIEDNSIPLTWTASGQNGQTAVGYDIRSLDLMQFGLVPGTPPSDFGAYCQTVLSQRWSEARRDQVDFGAPQPPGTRSYYRIKNRPSNTPHCVAIKVIGSSGTVSAISNGLYAETRAPFPPDWHPVVVDAGPWVTGNLSLAYDPGTGYPVIAYDEHTVGEVRLARWTGMSWDVDIIDTGNLADVSASLAFGPDGQPSVVFIRSTSGGAGDLTFAHQNASTSVWDRQTVERRKAREPHLVYQGLEPTVCYYMVGGGVRFARRNGSKWILETIDAAGEPPCSLAYDAAGTASVVFRKDVDGDGNRDLLFARRAPAGWQQPRLVESGVGLSGGSLAYDDTGHPTVAYALYPAPWHERFVRFATGNADGTNWTAVNVASPGYDVTHTFEQGRPVVVFDDYAYVRAATWDAGSGSWVTQIVDVKPYTSRHDLGLDPSVDRLSMASSHRSPDGTYILKFAHPGCSYAGGAEPTCESAAGKSFVATGDPAVVPAGATLSENYPNPFNPTTTFALTVDRTQVVRVEVFDLLGRRVALLHNGMLEAGAERRFSFDADVLPGGAYLYRAEGESFRSSKRMVLLK